MKLHRLELEGFGPFRERQTVDFDAFDDDGLFLITGRTGAGKSSILDGVSFALYADVPRYDGADRGVRCDHSGPEDQTEVRLEFSAAGRRWRVTRTPEYVRPKARGDGTTLAKASALLEERHEGVWIGRASRQREVGELVREIVGLDAGQFQQVILLAQNRFAKFLLAGNDERQALLRSLFDSRRYRDYEEAFRRRQRDAEQALATDRASLDAVLRTVQSLIDDNGLAARDQEADAEAPFETATPRQRLEAATVAIETARTRTAESDRRRAEAESARDAAEHAHTERTALRERQEQRDRSRSALEALTAQAAGIREEAARLERARSAEGLRSPIAAAGKARSAADSAEEATATARERWVVLGGDPALDAAALDALARSLSAQLGGWVAAAEQERALPELLAQRAAAEALLARLAGRLAAIDEDEQERARRREELEPLRAQSEVAAAALDGARAALATAEARHEAGRSAAALAVRLRDAERAHLTAVENRNAAAERERALLQRRMDGYAGELSARLVPGQPCAVCGSIEHPHPAPHAAEPVTEEAIESAGRETSEAGEAVELAAVAARDARAAHGELAARSGGESVDALAAAVERARAAVDAAEGAVAERDRIAAELRRLGEAQTRAVTARETLATQLATAREERSALDERIGAADTAVAAARGEFGTVAERRAAAERERQHAIALAEAQRAHAVALAQAIQRERERDELLESSAFDSVEAAAAALWAPSEQEAASVRIRAHEIAAATETDRLRELDLALQGAPPELVDTTESGEAAAAARVEWNAAVLAAARVEGVLTQLLAAVEHARATYAQLGERTAAHELVAALAGAIAGRTERRMDLETFVLAAELEQIVAAANLRLDAMSAGRYRLQHSDAVGKRKVASGLGLAVFDAYTGRARAPQSLSGGETFLASLALALGLAQVVTDRAGGLQLDTLFVDEGFGSLDAETLELAMTALDELRQGGRTVGVISHVEAMKEQIPAQLRVQATGQGPSVIVQSSL